MCIVECSLDWYRPMVYFCNILCFLITKVGKFNSLCTVSCRPIDNLLLLLEALQLQRSFGLLNEFFPFGSFSDAVVSVRYSHKGAVYRSQNTTSWSVINDINWTTCFGLLRGHHQVQQANGDNIFHGFKLLDVETSSSIFSILWQYMVKKLWGTKLRWCAGGVDTDYSWCRHLDCDVSPFWRPLREWRQCKSVEETEEMYQGTSVRVVSISHGVVYVGAYLW